MIPALQDVLFMQKVMFNQLNSDSVTKLYVNCIPVDIYILILKKKKKERQIQNTISTRGKALDIPIRLLLPKKISPATN